MNALAPQVQAPDSCPVKGQHAFKPKVLSICGQFLGLQDRCHRLSDVAAAFPANLLLAEQPCEMDEPLWGSG